MTDKIKISLILLLAVLALVLGFLGVKKSGLTSFKSAEKEEVVAKIGIGQYSEEEMKLLRPPEAGASKEEVDEHSKLAGKLAVVGGSVELLDCKSKPLVLQSSIKNSVMLKNAGTEDIIISFDGKKEIKIGTGKSVDVKSSLINGPGLYGYLCEYPGFKGLTGFVLATP